MSTIKNVFIFQLYLSLPTLTIWSTFYYHDILNFLTHICRPLSRSFFSFLHTAVEASFDIKSLVGSHTDAVMELKRASHTQSLSKNAQLQATVNYSCLCSLHCVILISNHQCQAMSELCLEPLWYGEQPNAIARQLNLCFIFI